MTRRIKLPKTAVSADVRGEPVECDECNDPIMPLAERVRSYRCPSCGWVDPSTSDPTDTDAIVLIHGIPVATTPRTVGMGVEDGTDDTASGVAGRIRAAIRRVAGRLRIPTNPTAYPGVPSTANLRDSRRGR